MDAITRAYTQIAQTPRTKSQLQAHSGLSFSQTLQAEQNKGSTHSDNPLSKIAEGKPDFSHMTKCDIVDNINSRYDADIEKHYGTPVGVELKQAKYKELKDAGISTAERQEIERGLYIAANGFEGFSDDEIKTAILDKYGHAKNLAEKEYSKMANELATAGVGRAASMLIVTHSRKKEVLAMFEMQRNGTYYEGAEKVWRLNNSPSNEKMDWPAYYSQRLDDYKSYGADSMSIATLEKVIREITIS